MGRPGDQKAIEQQDQGPAGGLERRWSQPIADGSLQGPLRGLYTDRVNLRRQLRLVSDGPEEQLRLRPGKIGVSREPVDYLTGISAAVSADVVPVDTRSSDCWGREKSDS